MYGRAEGYASPTRLQCKTSCALLGAFARGEFLQLIIEHPLDLILRVHFAALYLREKSVICNP